MVRKKRRHSSDKKKIEKKYAEVIFLDYIKRFSGKHEFSWPRYFSDEFGIWDASMFQRHLIREGYLFRDREGKLVLTEKGNRYVRQNDDYLKFFDLAVSYVDITEYEKARRIMKSETKFEAVMITLLRGKINLLKAADDFTAVKELHVEVAKLYERLGMKPQAVYHYLTFLYFQTSGLEYYDRFIAYINGKISKDQLALSFAGIYINFDMINMLNDSGEIYYEEMSQRVYDENPIRLNICTKNNFKQLVGEIIAGTYKNAVWQKIFKKDFLKLVETASSEMLKGEKNVV